MRQGVSKSICCTPSYKKNYEYNKILKSNAYNKKREIIVVGNSGLEKSFQKMYPEFLSENNFIPCAIRSMIASANGLSSPPS